MILYTHNMMDLTTKKRFVHMLLLNLKTQVFQIIKIDGRPTFNFYSNSYRN